MEINQALMIWFVITSDERKKNKIDGSIGSTSCMRLISRFRKLVYMVVMIGRGWKTACEKGCRSFLNEEVQPQVATRGQNRSMSLKTTFLRIFQIVEFSGGCAWLRGEPLPG